ncbi:Lrp/AsnC family transcriptional regulator [Piscinibacter sakaiensis]|uniref:Transcriptional regulator, AsnC family n=1 Tax=Piscinibacter sakaiensis TaxID=1547922 RepID=A0A0K8P2E4_PISS1|nr:Lrp/AsnC family transcriptional regulator [Piscinibacter sakaiensis]GAP36345.1 transcriptional regulator, AsnC family [Piscinibacter sakaiensis]
MAAPKIDAVDVKLLALLQRSADRHLAELAEAVGLSQTPCWRRVQRLRQDGVITANVALLDRAKINLGVTVFVSIRTNVHTPAWFERFKATIDLIPEVVEFYRMSGDVDYMLRVVVPDIAAYDRVYKRLIQDTQLSDVNSSFAMEQLKYTTALPLSYVG